MVVKLKHAAELFVLDNSIPSNFLVDDGYRPDWLLTAYKENVWVVTDTGDKANRTIKFDTSLPNGKHLSDYPNLLDSIKRVTYGIRSGSLMSVESGSVQQNVCHNLIILASWMVSNNICRFTDLTPIDVKNYAELAVYGVNSILDTEALLHRHIEKILASANFDVEDSRTDRQNKAKKVFPVRLSGVYKNVEALNRDALLVDAGLGCTTNGLRLQKMLDEIEAMCEFYQSPMVKQRMDKAGPPDVLDEKVVTTEHLRRLLMPFEYLYQHRRNLDDGIPRTLFPGSSPRAVANKLGMAIGRTGTVPVQQAAVLIERAIRWVIDYAPTLLELHEGKDSKAPYLNSSPGSPFPILPGYRKNAHFDRLDELLQAEALREGMTLSLALNYLMTACSVVIAAFSARRAAEILGLKSGCIELDETGKPWMRVFIHKTIQGETVIPVPEAVTSAVEVLERLSSSARKHNGTPYLFQYQLLGKNKACRINSDGVPIFPIRYFLRKFGYFIDVPALSDGTRWTFRPHQFRRFYAILYIWIYELGDWGALSYQLRHFNPEMTRRYSTDKELGQILATANREHTAQILTNAAMGKVKVSGVQGTWFKNAAKRLYDRLSQQLQVVPEHKFEKRVMRLVERTGVIMQAMPWGYCAIMPKATDSLYACVPAGSPDPDYTAATFSSCKDCVYGFRTPVALPYLKNSLELHQKIVMNTSTPNILRRASETLSEEIREYIDSLEAIDKGDSV